MKITQIMIETGCRLVSSVYLQTRLNMDMQSMISPLERSENHSQQIN